MHYPDNYAVEVIVSDPWEWGTEVGVGPFSAVILAWRQGAADRPTEVLFALDEPKTYRGVTCTYFVGSPRRIGRAFEDVLHGRAVDCDAVRVPEERALSTDPFDMSWWRGGVSILCVLYAKGRRPESLL